ncbi:hypothetical protein A0H81_12882 [Grifola frondosa]|uniref:F-box domain-containing protein n=1 Tax=Grifola frondosa TaxID=5627 RepID=A0A1C7LSN9_GRIFR|nr:hypothetical protein A0H81_12882 [Grifola frondosa]
MPQLLCPLSDSSINSSTNHADFPPIQKMLRVPELLSIMIKLLASEDYGKPHRTLASLARTGRAFHDLALNELWASQDSLINLVRCLPQDAWQMSEVSASESVLSLTRSLLPEDWTRFKLYAQRIKNLGLHKPASGVGQLRSKNGRTTIQLDREVLVALNLFEFSRPLLPNLRTLRWSAADFRDTSSFIHMFLGIRLKELLLHCSESNRYQHSVKSLLAHIPLLSPQLDSVVCDFGTCSMDLSNQSLKSLAGICDLKRVGLTLPDEPSPGAKQVVELLAFLATLSKLDSLMVFAPTTISRNQLVEALSGPHDFLFESLAKIYLRGIDLATATSSMQLLKHAPRVTQVYYTLKSDCFPQPSDVRAFCEAVATHRLQELRITGLKVRSDTNTIQGSSASDLRSLFVLHGLSLVHIDLPLASDIDDSFMKDLASAFPLVQYLRLGMVDGFKAQTAITLEGIVHLVKHCPHLTHLGLVIDATTSPRSTDRRPGGGVENELMTTLYLGNSKIIHSHWVAAFLSDIFPNLTQIVSGGDAEDNRRWKHVSDLLGVFVAVRRQERRSREASIAVNIKTRTLDIGEFCCTSIFRNRLTSLSFLPPPPPFKMHKALEIVEIFSAIIEPLKDDQNKWTTSLAILARTCRAFHEPALDALWEFQPNLVNLIKCMPQDAWKIVSTGRYMFGPDPGELCFSRTLLPTDWIRFDFYAGRIRQMGLPPTPPTRKIPTLDREVFVILSLYNSSRPLLPNLHWLAWRSEEVQNRFSFVHLFLGPKLRSLCLDCKNTFPCLHTVTSVLSYIPQHSPLLRHLVCIGESSTAISAELLKFFERHKGLMDVGFTIPSVSGSEWAANLLMSVATFPALHALKVRVTSIESTNQLLGASSALQDLVFPSLRKFVLHSLELSTAATATQLLKRTDIRTISVHLSTLPAASDVHLALRGDSWEFNSNADFHPSDADLKALFSLRALKWLVIDFPVAFKMDDAFIKELAMAWPLLSGLQLGRCDRSKWQSSITLEGLAHLVKHCPRLTSLELIVDASAVAKYVDKRPGGGSQNHAITKLRLGSSAISDPLAVAAFLSDILPNLITIETLGNADITRQWKEVSYMLGTFAMVRRQERLHK